MTRYDGKSALTLLRITGNARHASQASVLGCVRVAAGLAAAVLVGGCVTVSREAAFSDVQATVSQRMNQRVQWNRGTADDEAASRAVRNMLREPLTADRAVQIALLNNRRLQACYEELGIAQGSLVQAGLLRNPIFSATARYPDGDGSPNLDLGITQDFLSIFFLPLRRQVAANEFEAAKLRVTGEVFNLAAEVRTAFYRLQAEEQTIALLQQVVTATGAEFDASRRLYDAGNITEQALASSQALLEEARLALARAEANRTFAHEQMNVLLGLWGADTQWKVDARLPDISQQEINFADVEKRAVAANLGLAATRNQLIGATQRFGLGYAWPDPFDIGIEFERDEGEWSRGPSLEFAIPLFDFGQARRASGRSVLRQLEHAYTAQAIEVRSKARTATQALATARASALHVRDVIVPLRTRIVEQTQLQYNAMQVGIFQLLQAKREQIAAGRRYIESLRDYWIARGELEQLLSGHMTTVARSPLSIDMSGPEGGEGEGGIEHQAGEGP